MRFLAILLIFCGISSKVFSQTPQTTLKTSSAKLIGRLNTTTASTKSNEGETPSIQPKIEANFTTTQSSGNNVHFPNQNVSTEAPNDQNLTSSK